MRLSYWLLLRQYKPLFFNSSVIMARQAEVGKWNFGSPKTILEPTLLCLREVPQHVAFQVLQKLQNLFEVNLVLGWWPFTWQGWIGKKRVNLAVAMPSCTTTRWRFLRPKEQFLQKVFICLVCMTLLHITALLDYDQLFWRLYNLSNYRSLRSPDILCCIAWLRS